VRELSEMPGIWHARRAARAIAGAVRRRSARGVVLLYHRIAGPRRDPQWLDVSASNFERQLGVLARECAPLALDEFERRRRSGTLPPRAVTVTFDDGYADNLLAAAPLIEKLAVPATVFVTAGMTGATGEFWWDDVERIAFSSRRLAGPVPGLLFPWSAADGEPLSELARDAWTIAREDDPTPRHRLYRAICAALRPLDAHTRESALSALRAWAGVIAVARPSHRTLSFDELRALALAPGLTIGAHTMTHPVLSLLPASAQREELGSSRETLERELGGPVRVTAYPYGTRADVSAETVRAARDAGFDFALANEPGAAWRWSSRWRVPRHLVRDWDAAAFKAHLDRWFSE
jgi:peptidoglycan/xylan/chitin deacetylase (PgdA/CDA1 family)